MSHRLSPGVAVLALLLAGCGAAAGSGVPTLTARSVDASVAGGTDFVQVEHVETDNELPFTGPANNGLIGLGGGATGAFDHRSRPAPESVHEQGLAWLAAWQAPDGGWDEGWREGETHSYDPELTGRALLAFLGAGYTNRGNHAFAKTVARGLRYLKNVQDAEGWYVVPGEGEAGRPLRVHVFACAAMVEAYGMTESPIFKASAVRALDALADACDRWDADLFDARVAHGALHALLAARLVDENQRARGRKPRLAFDAARFRPLERFRYAARCDPVHVALATLARRVFAAVDDPLLDADLEILHTDLVATPFVWSAAQASEDPACWSLLRVAACADDCYACEGRRHLWRRGMKEEIERYRETSLAAEGLRGSWDPSALPGYRGTRLRLAVLTLGAL